MELDDNVQPGLSGPNPGSHSDPQLRPLVQIWSLLNEVNPLPVSESVQGVCFVAYRNSSSVLTFSRLQRRLTGWILCLCHLIYSADMFPGPRRQDASAPQYSNLSRRAPGRRLTETRLMCTLGIKTSSSVCRPAQKHRAALCRGGRRGADTRLKCDIWGRVNIICVSEELWARRATRSGQSASPSEGGIDWGDGEVLLTKPEYVRLNTAEYRTKSKYVNV